MSVSARENPRAPHNQPFSINGKRNKTKVNSWWNASCPTYWRNKRKDQAETTEKLTDFVG